MAGNRFDFELEAQDHASATIQQLEEKIGKLLPQLDEAGDKINLGGRKTRDGLDDLNDRLEKTGTFAKNSVQYFGDMVPPLKMVGELAGRYGGAIAKIGIGGAAAYGAGQAIASIASSMKGAAQDAYNLSVQAMDAGMSVHDLTQVAGGMEILGANTDKARESVVSLSRSLTDALNDRNNPLVGTLNQIGVDIAKRADGTADTMKTLEKLAAIYPTISAQKQKTVADALGITPEMLALLRDGLHYKELLAKSDKFGLTIDDKQIENLRQVNAQYAELDARLHGMWNRSNIMGKVADFIHPFEHGSASEQIKESQKYGKDDDTHFYHGNQEQDILHRARRDESFKKDLSFKENLELMVGHPGKELQDKLNKKYLASWRTQALQADMSKVLPTPTITGPGNAGLSPDNPAMFNQPRNNALGLRNHNPVNLRAASNETGKIYSEKSGSFSTFASDEDGLAAASRQLYLYGDRGKHTLQDVIKTFAPSKENNVQTYVDDVSRDSGFKPGENIDLHSPYVLERLLPAMIKHEQGTQPFSYDEVNKGINDAIFDPRWSSRRDPNQLKAQRAGSEHPLLSQYPPKSNADTKDAPKTPLMQQDSPGENEGSNNTIITKDDTAAILKALQEALSQAAKGGTTQIEVKFVKPNGEEELVRVPFGGKTSTSMRTY